MTDTTRGWRVTTSKYSCQLEAFDVIKKTAKMIVFLDPWLWGGAGAEKLIERRMMQVSDYYRWFDSQEQAKVYAVAHCHTMEAKWERVVNDICENRVDIMETNYE